MVKVFNPIFTIKIASKPKVKNSNISFNKCSRKCYAVVVKIDNEFKAVVNIDGNYDSVIEGDQFSNSRLTLPFTEESLDLKDKTYIFLKTLDKSGKKPTVIRTKEQCHRQPGLPTQYDAVKENLLIAGHIVRKNGKMYFDYEDLVKYHYLAEFKLCDVKIDNNKPLFSK